MMGRKEGKKGLLFLKKKAPRLGKQKNFCSGGCGVAVANAPRSKSFLLLFFKKEALSYCPAA
jgi:hypothetical protein